jgi:outer membrane protein OmpA-like peptidoglycan-associated protein
MIMAKEDIDLRKSKSWSIAMLSGGGLGAASTANFDLVNRDTARAHLLEVKALGPSVPFLSVSVGTSDYYNFATYRSVNFDDFDGRLARITSGSLPAYSWNWLTIFDSAASPRLTLLNQEFSGWGLSTPGAGIGHGLTGVLYYLGNGHPIDAAFSVPIEIAPEPEKLSNRITITQKEETPWIRIDGDALFDFDKDSIKPEGEKVLQQAGAVIHNLLHIGKGLYRGILIEGHTDSKGEPEYNIDLSNRRARSVAHWLLKKGYVTKGQVVNVKGYGATNPAKPNTRLDGSDDPAGRAQNRRVEVFLVRKL